MRQDVRDLLDELGRRLPVLQPMLEDLAEAWRLLVTRFDQGGRLLLCGNGGSASDSEAHRRRTAQGFTEAPVPKEDKETNLLRFAAGRPEDAARADPESPRPAQLGLPAIPLVSKAALGSAVANDWAPIWSMPAVMALGCPATCCWGLAHRNALNCCGIRLARGLGLTTIGLPGAEAAAWRLRPICVCAFRQRARRMSRNCTCRFTTPCAR